MSVTFQSWKDCSLWLCTHKYVRWWCSLEWCDFVSRQCRHKLFYFFIYLLRRMCWYAELKRGIKCPVSVWCSQRTINVSFALDCKLGAYIPHKYGRRVGFSVHSAPKEFFSEEIERFFFLLFDKKIRRGDKTPLHVAESLCVAILQNNWNHGQTFDLQTEIRQKSFAPHPNVYMRWAPPIWSKVNFRQLANWWHELSLKIKFQIDYKIHVQTNFGNCQRRCENRLINVNRLAIKSGSISCSIHGKWIDWCQKKPPWHGAFYHNNAFHRFRGKIQLIRIPNSTRPIVSTILRVVFRRKAPFRLDFSNFMLKKCWNAK